MARGKRPVTFRTRKLSLSAPMVLPWRRGGRVGRRRTTITERGSELRALAPVRVCVRIHAVGDLLSVRRQSKRYPEVMTTPRRGSGGPRGGRGPETDAVPAAPARSGAPAAAPVPLAAGPRAGAVVRRSLRAGPATGGVRGLRVTRATPRSRGGSRRAVPPVTKRPAGRSDVRRATDRSRRTAVRRATVRRATVRSVGGPAAAGRTVARRATVPRVTVRSVGGRVRQWQDRRPQGDRPHRGPSAVAGPSSAG